MLVVAVAPPSGLTQLAAVLPALMFEERSHIEIRSSTPFTFCIVHMMTRRLVGVSRIEGCSELEDGTALPCASTTRFVLVVAPPTLTPLSLTMSLMLFPEYWIT